MRLVVIVPAYNEEGSIGDVLASIPKILDDGCEVVALVVDDGSTDTTAKIAKKCGAIVVSHRVRSGLAAAFRTGLATALSMHADCIATLDADGQYRGEELQLLLQRMQKTGAELVVGNRQVRMLSHMPWKHRIGNIVGSAMLRILRCTTVTDASSGFRLFSARFGRAIRITSVHTYTHEMLIQAKTCGFTVAEVPVSFLPRKHGKSKLVRTLRHHILRSCGTIVRAYFRRIPHQDQKHVLFISRSLQQGAGGMQSYTRTLLQAIHHEQRIHSRVVGYAGGRFGLLFFLPYAWVRALCTGSEVVHFGDAASAVILPVLRFFRPNLRLTVTVYGLDLTYDSLFYQWLLRHSLPHAHSIVAISQATALALERLGVPREKIVVLPCAVIVPDAPLCRHEQAEALQILLLGRQIPRKGTCWFLRSVLPQILEEIPGLHCVIAGDGPELRNIRSAISEKRLEHSVSVLGAISDEEKRNLYASSSLFLMPNIPVQGDMEGFGLVCIEALSYGLPVVAARLEGIPDAIVEGVTGLLFEPLNADDCLHTIQKALSLKWHSEAMQEVCRQKFSPDVLASSYIEYVWE